MIHVEHLCKDYGSFRALDDVGFDIEKGESVGLLGPNGAGKTTTDGCSVSARILTDYMPPSEGQARVAGFDVFEDSLEVRKRIGYLSESVPLYAEMSVRTYLHYMACLRRVPERRQAVQRAMEACYIEDRADSLIAKLSKGLRQHVGLAQAIVHDPEVLILDEPTLGLDPKQIIEVRELIRGLGQDHTVILSPKTCPTCRSPCRWPAPVRANVLHSPTTSEPGTVETAADALRPAQGGALRPDADRCGHLVRSVGVRSPRGSQERVACNLWLPCKRRHVHVVAHPRRQRR